LLHPSAQSVNVITSNTEKSITGTVETLTTAQYELLKKKKKKKKNGDPQHPVA